MSDNDNKCRDNERFKKIERKQDALFLIVAAVIVLMIVLVWIH